MSCAIANLQLATFQKARMHGTEVVVVGLQTFTETLLMLCNGQNFVRLERKTATNYVAHSAHSTWASAR